MAGDQFGASCPLMCARIRASARRLAHVRGISPPLLIHHAAGDRSVGVDLVSSCSMMRR